MKISIVIPVYNESARIEKTLDCIYNNSQLPHEVIVVDGGSTDGTADIVRDKFPEVMLYINKEKTAASSRNVGIGYATGDIIAFTDGDCLVHVDWVKNICATFDQYDIDGIGGKVLNAPPVNRYEEYWGHLAWELIMNFPDAPYEVTERKLNDAFVTANCAYKKDLLVKIDGFNKWFANNAEDVDLCWRALGAGARLMYVPDVIIYAHNVTTLRGIAKKSFRNGVSSSKLQKIYGSKFNFDGNIYKMLFRNILGLFTRKKDAGLNVVELTCHLWGKYIGSLKVGVINF